MINSTLNLPGRRHYMRLFLSLSIVLSLTSEIHGFSFQPPAGRTGAPPGGMTCASCHTSTGNGSLSLTFGDGSLTYVPGETYPISVLLQDSGQSRFGYSMTARNGASPTVEEGTWTAGESSGVYDGGRHIGHMNAPFADDEFTFEMSWTAPQEDVGPIRFYVAGNAANGDRSNGSGDNVYTQQLTITPAAPDTPFWEDSALVDGWRYSGEGYSDLVGIGWIYDVEWPWIYTTSQSEGGAGEWVYIFNDSGDRSEFWAYNYSQGFYFRGYATVGWYYSLEPGAEGWVPYRL